VVAELTDQVDRLDQPVESRLAVLCPKHRAQRRVELDQHIGRDLAVESHVDGKDLLVAPFLPHVDVLERGQRFNVHGRSPSSG
jgi:hypothetical protein